MEGAFGNLVVAKEAAISLKKEITKVDGMHVSRSLSGPTPPPPYEQRNDRTFTLWE
ncbi:hypothetical protein Vi05172_g2648 [Venturia inaequalis]|nr:hypothetical protein Vi05172_g2648 [Venturia inaequalis]